MQQLQMQNIDTKKTAAVGRIGRKPYAQFKVNPLKCQWRKELLLHYWGMTNEFKVYFKFIFSQFNVHFLFILVLHFMPISALFYPFCNST